MVDFAVSLWSVFSLNEKNILRCLALRSSPQLSEWIHFYESTSDKIWKETQHTAHISSCFIYGTLGHSGRFHRFQVILDAYLHFTINFNIKMGVYFFLFLKIYLGSIFLIITSFYGMFDTVFAIIYIV